MLEQQKENDLYTCNFCGKKYTLDDTILTKGNHFLCSMDCVLAYQNLWDSEPVRNGSA